MKMGIQNSTTSGNQNIKWVLEVGLCMGIERYVAYTADWIEMHLNAPCNTMRRAVSLPKVSTEKKQ